MKKYRIIKREFRGFFRKKSFIFVIQDYNRNWCAWLDKKSFFSLSGAEKALNKIIESEKPPKETVIKEYEIS